MTGTLGHLEAISNGKPSANRPRGLHADVFGPGGGGWEVYANHIVPLLRPGMPVVFDRPGGNEPDGTIGDRPFYQAWVNDPNSIWSQRLRDHNALAACLARIRLANAGAPVWFYVGRPRQATPDGMILDLVIAGLVQGVCFDALVEQPQAEWLPQIRTYERHGAKIGYEELPKWDRPEYWRNPAWTCMGQVWTFQAEQAKIQQFPIHPNRSVDERAIAGPITLLDTHDNVEASRAALAKGQNVVANLASPAWKAALAPTPPATE